MEKKVDKLSLSHKFRVEKSTTRTSHAAESCSGKHLGRKLHEFVLHIHGSKTKEKAPRAESCNMLDNRVLIEFGRKLSLPKGAFTFKNESASQRFSL